MTAGSPPPARRLALIGYGRMGRLVEELAPGHGFEVALRLGSAGNPGGAGLTAAALEGIDAAIDFSAAAAVPDHVERLAALGVPAVVGTTGWLAELPRVRRAVEAAGAALVYGANFSVGVQVFERLVAAAGRLLAADASYEAWAHEIHHSRKKDAPSGTLLHLLDTLESAGYGRRVDVASSRAGAVPGTHLIGFDSEADTITLEHRARNRTGFAHGALRAAAWVPGKRGLFEFGEVWEETLGMP
ncbi:MAG TPA: dihydrodipicolinate reductase C-terminal domain-containing protein [Thermoanaerobaculia bacterium]|nr:dihydrodipicolinate reductase C-terminal domain-containing protein [Thermoanaerobaculia bacterium]